ncbi:hypothetical protein BXT86_05015 [candidate division WOR-3 bacterium 4484_100]|uniref:POTRA domain-containing protein n=1 Tax=candidate division WOR-3 bacterium 4484_100 TaxID=1936077 RepID=A0A1V4QEF5_UNCW3|nr:MAG: hypothetical protein BXT86_05015 [candidate division WOR-3 bacterium 4484_100]
MLLIKFIIIIFQTENLTPTIEISGNRFFSANYLMRNFQPGSDKERLEQFIKKIIILYNNAGFPFCRVAPEVVSENNCIKKIILKIEEGERVVVRDYTFSNIKKTIPEVLRNFIHLSSERYFSLKDIERAKFRLLQTGAFNDVKEQLWLRDGNYYVNFELTETKSDYINLFGSFAREDQHFGLAFNTLNLLGTLRRLNFNYEYQKLFALNFVEPVLIAPAEFEANFSLFTYDSLRQVKFDALLSAPVGENIRVSIKSGFENSQESHNTLGLAVSYNNDNIIHQNLSIEYLFRNPDRTTIKYDGAVNFKGLSLEPHYYYVLTNSFDFFDYLRLGGINDIRGYLDEEFFAKKAYWFNLEYHWLFLFPLLDLGWVGNNFIYAYGFGLTQASEETKGELILAWPRDGNWRDGKLHIILKRKF